MEGEELIKRGVFGQFDTFFLSPPRWWGRYSSLLHEDMDIPAPFLFYEGRKKILMKRGIGDPFETKALSGRTTSLLPPSLRCVSEWILLEKLRWKMDEFGTPGAAATRGNIRSRGRGELSCVTSLVTVQFTFLPRSTRREFYFPDRYICRRMHSDLSCHDLSRWNFLRGLLVKIFNFNRFLRPRILLCF